MSIRSTEALVIGSFNLIEADRIITLYTREFGKIKVVAKGIKSLKSKFGSSLETLTYLNIIYVEKEGRDLQYIRQADTIESHDFLRQNLNKLTAALYVVELVQHLIEIGEEGDFAGIFSLILKVLESLGNCNDIDSILRIFEIRILNILGFGPVLTHCICCNCEFYKGRWFFSAHIGGLICLHCISKVNDQMFISQGGVMFLRKALTIDQNKIARLHLVRSSKEEIDCILHKYILYQVQKELKSYPFLAKLRRIKA